MLATQSIEKKSGTDKVLKFGRNFNIAMAVSGTLLAATLTGAQPLLVAYNLWNGAQAVGPEAARHWQANKTTKKLGATALSY